MSLTRSTLRSTVIDPTELHRGASVGRSARAAFGWELLSLRIAVDPFPFCPIRLLAPPACRAKLHSLSSSAVSALTL